MRHLHLILYLSFAPFVAADEFNPFEGPEPVAVIIQSDPWKMVIGSDTPRVAIYDDGTVVFARQVDGRVVYHHAKVDMQTLSGYRNRLKPLLDIDGLKPEYDIAPRVTDQPEAKFHFRLGKRNLTSRVYGLTVPGSTAGPSTSFPDGPGATPPPDQLLAIHKWLCRFDIKDATAWTPNYVEVVLWNYSYAPDASIEWPDSWPSLESRRSIKRGQSYSIFLDGSKLPELRKFLAKRKRKGAVEIDGKKMSAAYRYTFPSEPIWRKAFYSDATKQ